MINQWLSLTHFRNHVQTEVDWGDHVNLITGPNGAGKTNLIDAIHYLCMGRSFTAGTDQYVLHRNADSFLVKGRFKGVIRSSFEIACSYEKGKGKKFWVNDSPLDRHADLIGKVPVILVSPQDRKLTGEGPVERRTFLDGLIAQTSASYLEDLIRYRKIVRQRNALLGTAGYRRAELKSGLEPWDVQLVESGSRIIQKRGEVVRKFDRFLDVAYRKLAGSSLRPSMVYRAIIGSCMEPDQIRTAFVQRLHKDLEREIERQQTLVGPHRDDLVFFLNDMELRRFGSQGQHRLFALALKLAQRYYYDEILDDLPVFLLDDLFGDLDPEKTKSVLNMLVNHAGQSFITAADPGKISGFSGFESEKISKWHLNNGTITTGN